MKTNVSARLLPFTFAIMAIALSLAPTTGSAQTDLPPVKHPGNGIVLGISGNFKSTDGVSGNFQQTEIPYSVKSSITTVILTRSTDQATRTETTTDLTNADGTRTESLTVTDYGATTSFTSSRTITSEGRGQSVGQGTYLAADGTTGTLTTLETQPSPGVDVLSTVYNSPGAGISHEQRTQTTLAGKTVIKTLNIDPSGNVTSVVQTRIPISAFPVHAP